MTSPRLVGLLVTLLALGCASTPSAPATDERPPFIVVRATFARQRLTTHACEFRGAVTSGADVLRSGGNVVLAYEGGFSSDSHTTQSGNVLHTYTSVAHYRTAKALLCPQSVFDAVLATATTEELR